MKPVEAFQYLSEHNLPLVLAFPLEEEKGHIITGKGVCHIEKIHGSSRVTLGRFHPSGLLYYLSNCQDFSATFEIKGETYFCSIEGLIISGSIIVADIPTSLKTSMRKFLRVEPSRKAPVTTYITTSQYGTLSFAVQDISERGSGFFTNVILDIEDAFTCGLELPIDNGRFILSKASVVYKRESSEKERAMKKKNMFHKSNFYGLEFFPHNEDGKKIRLYIMKRELEIRRTIQGEF
jgi:hypothetical protein